MLNGVGPLLAEVTRLRAALTTERRTVEELKEALIPPRLSKMWWGPGPSAATFPGVCDTGRPGSL